MQSRKRAPTPTLPTLDTSLTLLASDDAITGALQSLVLDHVLGKSDHSVYWIDTDGTARTTTLARLAPHSCLLDRIAVARGFTAYQHYRLIERLVERVATGPTEPSLIVVPAVDGHYRDVDPQGLDAREMLTRGLDRLAALATAHDLPVLLTRTQTDGFAAPVETAAETTIVCEQTRFGPRFIGEEETLVYPTHDGTVQTTLAFWQEVLAARVTASSTPTEPGAVPATDGMEGVLGRGAE